MIYKVLLVEPGVRVLLFSLSTETLETGLDKSLSTEGEDTLPTSRDLETRILLAPSGGVGVDIICTFSFLSLS